MPLAKDLVHPSLEDEKRKHKKKRLVQSPNSYFMDVKCPAQLQECALPVNSADQHSYIRMEAQKLSCGNLPPGNYCSIRRL